MRGGALAEWDVAGFTSFRVQPTECGLVLGGVPHAAIGGGRNIVRVCAFGYRVFLNGLRDGHRTGERHDAGHDSTASLAQAPLPCGGGRRVTAYPYICNASPGESSRPQPGASASPVIQLIREKEIFMTGLVLLMETGGRAQLSLTIRRIYALIPVFLAVFLLWFSYSGLLQCCGNRLARHVSMPPL